MNYLTRIGGIAAAALFAMMLAAPAANAQATRTWISGVGDDANPCSRTAPCKTFAGAISKTAAGGEIDCLDPGGFGQVTITKSITLDCGGGIGGWAGSILVVGTNGINVNAGAADLVKIRNLTINGIQKSGSPGLSGIKFNTGGSLIVEHVGIFGMGGTAGSNGGVDFQPQGASKLLMLDVEVQYGLGDGILVKPTATGSATGTLNRVSSIGNTGAGLRVDATNTTSGNGSVITAFQSEFSGDAVGVSALSPAGSVTAAAYVTNSVLSGNTTFGALGSGTNALIVLGGNTVTANATGLAAGGGSSVKSFGDNYFWNGAAGTSNGTPTATAPTPTKL